MLDRTSLPPQGFPVQFSIAATLRRFGLLAVAAISVATVVPAAAADKPTRWSVTVDPPAAKLEWPKTLKLAITQPASFEEVLFPSTPSEFCLVGLAAYESDRAELWNLATGQRVGGITGKPQKAIKRALSPDGKFMALVVLDNNKLEAEVWSLEGGKKLCTFSPDDKGLSLTLLDFAGPTEVLTYTFGQVSGKFVHRIRIWDVDTGKQLRQLNFDKNISADKYSISPGRNWMSNVVGSEVLFFDLQTGQTRGIITPPGKTEDDHSVHLEGVRFSPDGTELAVLSEGSGTSLLSVYDVATGEVKLKHELASNMKSSLQHAPSYKGPDIEFVAEPPGFLWHGGGFIDRETGLLVWTYKQGILEYSHWQRTLTPAGLIVSAGGSGARKIQVLPFPAEKLQKTLEAYRGDAPAIVKPGLKVKVSVKVGAVRFGKPDEAQKSIETVLAERLADDGLEVADDGNTALSIEYKEMAGKTLQEFKGGNPITGAGAVATGRTVQSTAGEVKLKWATKDGKTKIYETTLNLDPSYLSIRNKEGQITDAAARAQVFEILKLQLAGLPMPYFFPEDKSLSVLPLTTSSDMAAPLSPQDALKKKIEAKKNLGKKPAK